MSALTDRIEGRRVEGHRPWPRVIVRENAWRTAAELLAAGQATLLSLWGDINKVHMALLDESSGEKIVVTLECPDRQFPSVAAHHLPAQRLERAIRDLYGLEPVGPGDDRPWLNLGFWGVMHPLGDRRQSPVACKPYAFLPVEGENLHQIPVGPVHAGIIEPGHFRFTANGETIVRLEERLGYVHKGIDSLMSGADLERGAKLAARVSGDSTVAYAIAFAQAVEAALQMQIPARAVYLRALMAELERMANHFGDIGAICNDASFAIMHAHCGILRERTLRAADACFGHRLMMDCVVPGGVARDLFPNAAEQVRALLQIVRASFPQIVELYENTASLQDRTATTGILKPDLARRFGAGGYVGRASGRAFDARRPGYAPYDELTFDIPVLDAGDVDARIWIRIREVEQSLSLVEQILQRLPAGDLRAAIPEMGAPCDGVALVEGFRGDVLAWIRIEDNHIGRCHLRDPSWFQWPLLEAVIEGNIVADFPLCNKSFNCSYSGHDL